MQKRLSGKRLLMLASMVALAPFSNSGTVCAQDFPNKSINLVIPTAMGGSSDLTARTFVPLGQAVFGQPVVMQIRPGGGGAIGTEMVAQAKPDGYTLSFGHSNWNSVLPALEGLSKGPNDMETVCRINIQNVMYWMSSGASFKTMPEVIEYAKANPSKLTYGNSGAWSVTDLMWRWLEVKAGIKTRNVTLAGGGEAIIQLLGGHVQVAAMGPVQTLSHYRAGKLKPLAVEAPKRYKGFPDVPTMKELGYDNKLEGLWKGVLAPKGTPRPIIDKLAAGFKKMTEQPEAIEALAKLGEDFEYLGPDEFAKFWRSDYQVYKDMAGMFKK